MPWQAWAVVAWLAFNAAYQFYLVDRPREPKTLREAYFALFDLALVAWAAAWLGTNLG